MRIGTWNLGGRWGDQHRAFLRRRDCDVWLLTEVRTDVQLHGYQTPGFVRAVKGISPAMVWKSSTSTSGSWHHSQSGYLP